MLGLTLMGATELLPNPTFAQETFRIDYERGRTVIEGPWRAIDPYEYAIDHTRRVLYVHDLEEPDGIMAFSLESGEWLRTIRIPLGEGPGELRGFGGVALAPEGSLYLWRYPKAILVNAMGAVVGEWRPDVTSLWMDMCVFGSEPALPTPHGLIRRGAGGRDESIDAQPIDRGVLQAGTPEEAVAALRVSSNTRLSCTDDAAFVVPNHTGDPGAILVYTRSGMTDRFEAPPVILEDPVTGADGRMDLLSDDGQGNIVLIARDPFGRFPGALMDPKSGCHALLRNPRVQSYRQFAGIHADSALVFHWDHEEEVRDGKRIIHIRDRANRVTLHPLVRLGGGEGLREKDTTRRSTAQELTRRHTRACQPVLRDRQGVAAFLEQACARGRCDHRFPGVRSPHADLSDRSDG